MKARSRLLGRAAPCTANRADAHRAWLAVYEALVPLACGRCAAEILPGAWFTYTRQEGPGLRPLCRVCRNYWPDTFDERGPLRFDARQAARFLNLRPSEFLRLARAGEIPGLPCIGMRWERRALEEWERIFRSCAKEPGDAQTPRARHDLRRQV